MKPLTQEWVDKAEGDFSTAGRELRARKDPNYDSVCFHSQQCVEKYFKAYLQDAGVAFAKTHDLVVLLDLLLPMEPSWDGFRLRLRSLTTAAVEIRYPGKSADKLNAKEMYKLCQEMRDLVQKSLGIPP
jgi:HEPN domain-containing protein